MESMNGFRLQDKEFAGQEIGYPDPTLIILQDTVDPKQTVSKLPSEKKRRVVGVQAGFTEGISLLVNQPEGPALKRESQYLEPI